MIVLLEQDFTIICPKTCRAKAPVYTVRGSQAWCVCAEHMCSAAPGSPGRRHRCLSILSVLGAASLNLTASLRGCHALGRLSNGIRAGDRETDV